jgi:REP element-mobilizing transposase RayT
LFARSPHFGELAGATCRFDRMQSSQLALFGKDVLQDRASRAHGGAIGQHQRKVSRPWDSKKPVHVVLRSSLARGPWSLLGPEVAEEIRATARTLADRYGVSLYRYANAGNHIHMLAHAHSKMAFQSFLSAFAGLTARLVTGSSKGKPVGRFWDSVAYSRLVSWGRELRVVGAYVRKNEDEALGLRPPRPRKALARAAG